MRTLRSFLTMWYEPPALLPIAFLVSLVVLAWAVLRLRQLMPGEGRLLRVVQVLAMNCTILFGALMLSRLPYPWYGWLAVGIVVLLVVGAALRRLGKGMLPRERASLRFLFAGLALLVFAGTVFMTPAARRKLDPPDSVVRTSVPSAIESIATETPIPDPEPEAIAPSDAPPAPINSLTILKVIGVLVGIAALVLLLVGLFYLVKYRKVISTASVIIGFLRSFRGTRAHEWVQDMWRSFLSLFQRKRRQPTPRVIIPPRPAPVPPPPDPDKEGGSGWAWAAIGMLALVAVLASVLLWKSGPEHPPQIAATDTSVTPSVPKARTPVPVPVPPTAAPVIPSATAATEPPVDPDPAPATTTRPDPDVDSAEEGEIDPAPSSARPEALQLSSILWMKEVEKKQIRYRTGTGRTITICDTNGCHEKIRSVLIDDASYVLADKGELFVLN